jgi:Na+/H+ antiporter NhaD/arsenite permease-like protein
MDGLVLGVFVVVYLGLLLGRLPWLALGRCGLAAAGALLLVAAGRLTVDEAFDALDLPTLALLLGLMVVSAQLRLGGFYSAVARRLGAARLRPGALLGLLVATAGALSAVLVNDIVCLAMAPLLVDACARRGLSPRPFLLALVDWPLLALFAGLFVVHAAAARTGAFAAALDAARGAGLDLSRPPLLFAASALPSNVVSNVPAVMLLLPAATDPLAGPVLALSSTFAGNLLLVGSIANLIVAEQAGRLGVAIGWREHARTGVPVTLGTLAVAAAWLWLRAA